MGRKSMKDEAKAASAINRSWDWVNRALKSKKLTDEEKGKIAVQIALRSVPKNLSIQSESIDSLADVMKKMYVAKKANKV